MGVPTAHYEAPHARPSLSVATHHRQPFYDLVPRDPKRQVPLTNNNKSGWPPGSRHPIQKLATLSDRTLPSQQGLGYRDASREASGPRRSKVDQQGNHVSAGPGCLKLRGDPPSTHTGFQMVNQLGPPLEMFEARQVRKGGPIKSHTRLGTLSLKTNTRNSDPR